MNTGVFQDADPAFWSKHLYGLTQERWHYLRGKSYWITGAGTGYGRSIACGLAAAGAKVFLTGRRVQKLKESLEEISSFGIAIDDCHIIPADLTNYEDIGGAISKIRSISPTLHGLVNNAALPEMSPTGKPLQDKTLEDWDRLIATNVTAPWLLTRDTFNYMKASGSVKVLYMTSEAGWASTPGFGTYNVSKAALNSLCHSIANEYKTSFPEVDIQINAVIPAEARTEMNQGSATSPYTIVSIVLILLSHSGEGPNGKFFHRDGRHFGFAYTEPYGRPLI